MKKYKIKLYIMGKTPNCDKIIKSLNNTLEKTNAEYQLEIIDILKDPEIAQKDKVLVTPTVIKAFPEPVRRVTGDLTDSKKLLFALGLTKDE